MLQLVGAFGIVGYLSDRSGQQSVRELATNSRNRCRCGFKNHLPTRPPRRCSSELSGNRAGNLWPQRLWATATAILATNHPQPLTRWVAESPVTLVRGWNRFADFSLPSSFWLSQAMIVLNVLASQRWILILWLILHPSLSILDYWLRVFLYSLCIDPCDFFWKALSFVQ